MFTPIKEDGTAGEMHPFASGWLTDDTGEYLGRLVDVNQYLDGSLLVSDDMSGVIYRISYTANNTPGYGRRAVADRSSSYHRP
ncbi:hypothetical protein GCM10028792_35830 [Salinisphaera aquimarina]